MEARSRRDVSNRDEASETTPVVAPRPAPTGPASRPDEPIDGASAIHDAALTAQQESEAVDRDDCIHGRALVRQTGELTIASVATARPTLTPGMRRESKALTWPQLASINRAYPPWLLR